MVAVLNCTNAILLARRIAAGRSGRLIVFRFYDDQLFRVVVDWLIGIGSASELRNAEPNISHTVTKSAARMGPE